MTLTRKDEAPNGLFWLAIGGILLSFVVGPVALLLCIPMLAFIFTPTKGETQ